jgi:hypothetical protein
MRDSHKRISETDIVVRVRRICPLAAYEHTDIPGANYVCLQQLMSQVSDAELVRSIRVTVSAIIL